MKNNKGSLGGALMRGELRGKTGIGGAFQYLFDNLMARAGKGGGGASGGAVAPKQKPTTPRVDPRGALPMNTMMNRGISGLAKPNMKRK